MLLHITILIYPQVPHVKTPQPASLQGAIIPGSQQAESPKENRRYQNHSINNENLIQEVQRNEHERRQQSLRQINEITGFSFPDFRNAPGADSFYSAYNEISDMLSDEGKLSLKRAVFLSENAYLDNKMSYKKFDEEIQKMKHICLLKMEEDKLNYGDNVAKIMTLFKLMNEEVTVKEPGTEKKITNYPVKYDFDDYRGEKNISQTFVSKLLMTNTGQCHSLPLMFLILAEEMDVKADLSFSPQHSYVTFQDNKGKYYNIELTSGAIVNDDFYMSSGYIKAEALRNHIYLEPQSKQQTIAHIMADLANYYIRKYGYDNFVGDCLQEVISNSPANIYAHLLYSNFNTARAMYVLEQYGYPPPHELPRYPLAYKHYKQMLNSYAVIDSLGFEPMPEEVYHNWLLRVEKEKEKPENQPSPVKQLKQ